jgi:Tfp pilus assembly protein PilO
MSRPILSTFLIVVSIALFFSFTDPTYKDVKVLSAENAQFDEALVRARELQSVRDELLSRYNTFTTENLDRVEKILPDNVDNVRLILDLDGIASQYGIVIRDLSIPNNRGGSDVVGEAVVIESSLGKIELNFNFTSSYEDFKKFLNDLEQSLRIVDIKKISIKPKDLEGDLMDFDLNIETYWLK